ncbi:hypothetical protein TM5383_00039 [Thalassovita mediterranea]|uniref:Uncharacterized protein n=2 Tax=Thalassovita mediterranea TaxID=340021 RepID=A0A0P1GZB4_9RHOB|nr:hypothetical protein TM5383_00039 [Thalassovita mediterranea]SIS31504.1 hypothetical protein SAMN05421685_104233 [Thalassovita mediterranea]
MRRHAKFRREVAVRHFCVGFGGISAANCIAALGCRPYTNAQTSPQEEGAREVCLCGRPISGIRSKRRQMPEPGHSLYLMRLNWGNGMKAIYSIAALFWATTAQAHIGHLGDVAGHDHWIALGALGAAGVIALIAGLKGKKTDTEAADAASDEDATHDEELQEA